MNTEQRDRLNKLEEVGFYIAAVIGLVAITLTVLSLIIKYAI